jgi:putative proteasome-type protease
MWHGGATEVPLMVLPVRNALLKKITTPEEKLI